MTSNLNSQSEELSNINENMYKYLEDKNSSNSRLFKSLKQDLILLKGKIKDLISEASPQETEKIKNELYEEYLSRISGKSKNKSFLDGIYEKDNTLSQVRPDEIELFNDKMKDELYKKEDLSKEDLNLIF